MGVAENIIVRGGWRVLSGSNKHDLVALFARTMGGCGLECDGCGLECEGCGCRMIWLEFCHNPAYQMFIYARSRPNKVSF